jgi:HK97 family phage major capsid protein
MSEIENLENTVHEYRRTLDRFAARTGAQTHHVEIRGSGEEREKIARIDADLDIVERQAQDRAALRAANDRIAQLESERAQPQFRAALPAKREQGFDLASPEYARRWLNAVARGDQAEMREMSTSSTGAGIPTDMERRIVEKMYQANVLRSICPVSSIDSKRTVTVEGSLPSSALVAESVTGAAATISPSDATFGTAITVTPYKYVCATKMSQEFIEDAIGQGGIGSGLDWVASRIGLSLALKMEEAYTVGTGSSQPEGIAKAANLTGAISQVTDLSTAAITTISADNVIDTVHLVAPQYRNSPRFRWLVSDTFVRVARKLKNSVTSSGPLEYIWTQAPSNSQAMVGGAPGLLYGVPYSVAQYMPTATANNNVFAVVGDFNYFEIFDRTGMTSLVDPYSAAVNHQVTLYTYARTDSRIMLASAFAAITC